MHAVYLILAAVTASTTANAQQTCRVYPSLKAGVNPASFSASLHKQVQVEYVSKKTADFCRRNMMMRFLNSKDAPPADCRTIPMSDLERLVDRFPPKTSDLWSEVLKSTPDTRSLAVDYFGYRPQMSESFAQSNPAHVLQLLNSVASEITINDSVKKATMKTMACARESLFSIGSCKAALDLIEEKMTPVILRSVKLVQFTNIGAWRKVFGTTRLDKGLSVAFKRIYARVQSGNPGAGANVFHDLEISFIESGLAKPAAVEAAWDILGVISNGGPNTYLRALQLDGRTERAIAISYISFALGVLDLKHQAQGLAMYSYPSNVKTSCDNAKPYHFWMSAYLARSLVLEHKISPSVAERSTYIAQKGYQVMRDAGRNSTEGTALDGILSRAAYDPTHQIVRTDLAYAAAGARFGSSLGRTSVNVDGALVALVAASTAVAPKPKSELIAESLLTKITAWDQIFSANAAFRGL